MCWERQGHDKNAVKSTSTPGPLYNMVRYNKVLDITLIIVGLFFATSSCLYILLSL